MSTRSNPQVLVALACLAFGVALNGRLAAQGADSAFGPVALTITPTFSYAPQTVLMTGIDLDSIFGIEVDGIAATIVAPTPTTLAFTIAPLAPGLAAVDLLATGPGQTTLELHPYLTGVPPTTAGTVAFEIRNGSSGAFILAAGRVPLALPLPYGGIHHTIGIDLAGPYLLVDSGALGPSGVAGVTLSEPNDSSLSGTLIALQALTDADATSAASFSNLLTYLIP